MAFSVRERVQVSNLNNEVVGKGTIINYNDFRESGMEYVVLIDGHEEEVFVGENQLVKLEGVVQ